ncbi:hypothetical protein PR048_005023 [Dryococelus australis]|uniref:Uncharacterized protein n=1 Tax=Dryococelus australis TaxID=614101 RepID=A0ABQ9I716_9NEOP|nr:hypothetical protein PR048_005023 [Dryococelus australis]
MEYREINTNLHLFRISCELRDPATSCSNCVVMCLKYTFSHETIKRASNTFICEKKEHTVSGSYLGASQRVAAGFVEKGEKRIKRGKGTPHETTELTRPHTCRLLALLVTWTQVRVRCSAGITEEYTFTRAYVLEAKVDKGAYLLASGSYMASATPLATRGYQRSFQICSGGPQWCSRRNCSPPVRVNQPQFPVESHSRVPVLGMWRTLPLAGGLSRLGAPGGEGGYGPLFSPFFPAEPFNQSGISCCTVCVACGRVAGDHSSSRGWAKLPLLLWKNWLLVKRHPRQTAVEVLAPVFFALLLVLIRSLVDPVMYADPTVYPPFSPANLNGTIVPVIANATKYGGLGEFQSFWGMLQTVEPFTDAYMTLSDSFGQDEGNIMACNNLLSNSTSDFHFSLNPRLGHSRILASGNCDGRCNWSADFLGDIPFPLFSHYSAAPFSPPFTIIGSQDLVQRNAGAGKRENLRRNPPTRSFIPYNSHMRKSRSDATGNQTRLALMGAEHSSCYTTMTPIVVRTRRFSIFFQAMDCITYPVPTNSEESLLNFISSQYGIMKMTLAAVVFNESLNGSEELPHSIKSQLHPKSCQLKGTLTTSTIKLMLHNTVNLEAPVDKKDQRACTKIGVMVQIQCFAHRGLPKTVKEAWEKLKKAFEETGLYRRVELLAELHDQMLDGTHRHCLVVLCEDDVSASQRANSAALSALQELWHKWLSLQSRVNMLLLRNGMVEGINYVSNEDKTCTDEAARNDLNSRVKLTEKGTTVGMEEIQLDIQQQNVEEISSRISEPELKAERRYPMRARHHESFPDMVAYKAADFDVDEPKTLQDVLLSKDKSKWESAMQDDYMTSVLRRLLPPSYSTSTTCYLLNSLTHSLPSDCPTAPSNNAAPPY